MERIEMLIQMNRGTLSNYPTKKPGRKPGFLHPVYGC